MAQQVINVGASPNDGDGNPIRTAFIKCNDNFSELYSRAQTTPPLTLTGSPGDVAGMYAYDSSYFYYCYANYDGSTVIWAQVTQIGNVSLSAISSGNSSVELADVSGNATVSVAGVSNVAVFTTTGQLVTGIISSSGNITGDYILGNGSQLSGLPENYSNANVGAYLSTYSGNISAANFNSGNLLTAGLISTSGNIASQGIISASGNIETAGYFVGTFVGNVTGNFVVPGSNTQVIFNTNGNADAVSGFTFDSNGPNLLTVLGTISSQGNVIAGNVSTAGVVTATGNITAGNIRTAGLVTATGNITGGNVNTAGLVTATGNITGGNVNTAGLVTATGNITGGNIRTAGLISATGNLNSANIFATGVVSATGNITAANFFTSANISAGNIQLTGIGGYGELSVTGNTIIGGDLTVNGNTSYVNVTTLAIEDPIISIGRGANDAPLVSDDGKDRGEQLWYYAGSEKSAFIGYDNSAGKLLGATQVTITNELVTILDYGTAVFGNVETQGQIVATGNISGANITTAGLFSTTGNVTGGNLLTSGLITATGNIHGGNIRTAGLITATGAITGAALTGTSLTVTTGNVTAGNIVNGNANGVGNIGSSTTYFNTVFAQATSAQYADLAECYLADGAYAPGTVVEFGGTAEITQCNTDMNSAVVGVVSTRPAYLMNSGLTGGHVAAVALMGRVPCRVQGTVTRGALMVSAGNGRAREEKSPAPGTIIGKAVGSSDGTADMIEILVGKV
jgi:hypothetical protein